MMSVTIFLITLICCLLSGHVESEDTCDLSQEYFSVFNSFFDNSEQRDRLAGNITSVQVFYLPVSAPVLESDQVFLAVAVLDGQVLHYQLNVVQEVNGRIVVTYYILVNPRYTKWPIENLDQLDYSNLTLDDVHHPESCEATFEKTDDDRFVGFWDICLEDVAEHLVYDLDVGCDDMIATVPPGAFEKPEPEPFKLKRVQPRLYLPGAPQSCPSVCP